MIVEIADDGCQALAVSLVDDGIVESLAVVGAGPKVALLQGSLRSASAFGDRVEFARCEKRGCQPGGQPL